MSSVFSKEHARSNKYVYDNLIASRTGKDKEKA